MSIATDNTIAEKQIRTILNEWSVRVLRNDTSGVMELYDPCVVVYDAIGTHRFKGTAAYKAHWEACMESCPGGAQTSSFDLHEVEVHVDGSAAFAHCLHHVTFPGQDGKQEDIWMRSTFGLRRREDGEWRIVHDHSSAPFDMHTGKSLCTSNP